VATSAGCPILQQLWDETGDGSMTYGDEILAQARRARQLWQKSGDQQQPPVPDRHQSPVLATLTRPLTYPNPLFRGCLITRLEERVLGSAVLDATAADELGREHLGWFVGNHPGTARAAEQLGRLDANPEGGIWVVVPVDEDVARGLFAKWPCAGDVIKGPSLHKATWQSRKVWVACPEDLKQVVPLAKSLATGVAGVIVLDPECTMYKARGKTNRWGRTYQIDRPQQVVDFRASLDARGWQPPFLLITTKPAKAVNTDVVARVFQLNAFRFISGESFNCLDMLVA
jgi:hypothetical protein